MLSALTSSALAIVGTPVLSMVVSRASMKKATATNQGKSILTEAGVCGLAGLAFRTS